MIGDVEDVEYWKTLILGALRLAVRMALRTDNVTLADLKTLLEIAIVEELHANGYTSEAMSVMLGCSLRTVNRYRKRARAPSSTCSGTNQLRKVLKRLIKYGPQTHAELSGCTTVSEEEFDSTRVALSLLLERGAIEQMEGSPARYRPIPEYSETGTLIWETPLTELERVYALGLNLLQWLTEGEATLESLRRRARLEKETDGLLSSALDLLMRRGYVGRRPARRGRPPTYCLEADEVKWMPLDPLERTRVGLLDMFQKLGKFMDVPMKAPGGSEFSQRAWVFRAREADVRCLFSEYKAFVSRRLGEIEAAVGDNRNAVRCVMISAAAVLGTQ